VQTLRGKSAIRWAHSPCKVEDLQNFGGCSNEGKITEMTCCYSLLGCSRVRSSGWIYRFSSVWAVAIWRRSMRCGCLITAFVQARKNPSR